ncbi:hypothetical protein [Kitasatospora sp. NPDC018619]|uniref:hypothetical protein n=1 Tax=unclassified Kitasatospora TaxID=2633591 RepID=UPI00379FD763
MSVDHDRRRLPGRAVDTCRPEEPGRLVPRDRAVRYGRPAAAGHALGVRRTAALGELAPAENGPHPEPAARLSVHGGGRPAPDGALPAGALSAGVLPDGAVPVLRPEQVRRPGSVPALTVAPRRHPTPWPEAWAALVVHGLREPRDLFAGAAAGDAVAVREAA